MSHIVEIHILKNYPYSNLNRDEAGTPKTAVFGGINRGRISSQSLKRSWRLKFDEMFGLPVTSKRTRKMPEVVKDLLVDEGVNEEAALVGMEMLAKSFGSNEKASNATGQIIPLGNEEIGIIADFMKDTIGSLSADELKEKYLGKDTKEFNALRKELGKRTVNCGNAVDIALFGRMATSEMINDVEAAMQVAHAISTNRVDLEEDFFTAVDDMLLNDETGAAMMGITEHDSCCYYEYAALNLDILKENLKYNDTVDEIIEKMIPAVIRTMAFANPSGKANSTGSNELPLAILVETKDVPYNLSNAFVKPVTGAGDGLVVNSIRALADHCDLMNRKYAIPAKRVWFSVADVELSCADYAETFDDLLNKVKEF